MSFLSAFFLFGLTAISIPILIHLLNRRASRQVEWGAMRFLRESFVSRRRRILLEEILLLATRCLLIGCVALAQARPVATPESRVPWFVVLPLLLLGLLGMGTSFALWRQPWWRIVLQIAAAVLFAIAAALVLLEHRFHLRRFGAGSARDVVIVIDGSASMTLKVDGKTNFERAVEEAIQIVRSADRRTAFGVILAGLRPDVKTAAPLSDRRELEDVLRSLKPGDGSMQTLDALFAAAVVLSQGHNPAKQIVLFTDSQKIGWETEMPAKWELLAAAFKRLSGTPQIICRQFKPPQRLRNLAVTRLEFSRRVIGTDRPVTIFVTLENTGSEAVTPGSVTLSLGNTELVERTVDQFAPGKMATIPFSYWFTNAGAYMATAQVTVDDDLSCDNICRKAFAVMREVEVLVVDGHPGGWFSEGAAIFTRLALAPGLEREKKTKTPEKEAHTLIRPNVIAAWQLMREDALRRYAAIVLVDVPYLPPEAALKLARYVAAGGGLIIAPGARISAEFYNHWSSSTGQPIMPTEFATQIELPDEKESVSASLSTFSHQALRLVADPQQTDLDSLRVSAYWRLVPRETGSPATVAGRLTSGDPFLVEGRCGRGTIFVSACAFDGRRSNLVSRRAFLPMLHELVMYLASMGQPDLNLASGTISPLLLASTAAGSVASARFGIFATYYTGVFQSPCAWRVDPMLDFNWHQDAPVPALRDQQFSVRWIGSLVPRYSEKYTLRWVGTGTAEIWIDGNLIIKPGQSVGEVNLEADRHHD
ncbi:MAG: BatA domain-containing protein, partial [Kiritimatiellia bacterium]